MLFNRLDTLLQANRDANTVVAFNAQQRFDWQHFRTQVHALSTHLSNQQATRWALCCEDSYQFCIAFFALALANKKIVLPGNHQPEMLHSLRDEFDAMLHDKQIITALTEDDITLPFAATCSLATFKTLTLADVSLTLFTSGSSGQPKAIIKTLALLDNEIQQLEKKWGALVRETEVLSTVSHQHIYGLLFRILWPLCAARPFACQDLIYPEQVISHAQSQFTLISSPALLKRIEEVSPDTGYAAVFSSGGPLNFDAASQSKVSLKQLPIEVFGSTETGGIGYRQQQHSDTPWTLFDCINAKVDAQGCLILNSPFIVQNNWYQTSDKCQLLNNQQFLIKGRADKIVKIEEKRVSLNEVEQRLNALPWINDSAVLLLDNAQRSALGAVITLNEQGVSKINKCGKGKFWLLLRQQLRQWIEPVAVPRHFRVVDEIPVNTQGKRIHAQLNKLFNE